VIANAFQAALDAIYRTLSVAATYESVDDGETEVHVIVSYDLTQWGDTISVQNNMAVVAVRRSEVEARPRRGDTFAVAGAVYNVERVLRSDELEHRCLVVADDD
jgi:hypothetical protein